MKIRKILSAIFITVILSGISSCCIFKNDSPDLKVAWATYSDTAIINQPFEVKFSVGNFATGDCDAETTNQTLVNLKMIRGESLVDYDENQVLNSLYSDGRQNFTFTVNLRYLTTYHMIFTVDPENKSGDSNNGNNTYTADILVH